MIRHPKYPKGNIYLSGGMQFATDLGAGWREVCSKQLKSMGYYPLDICELDRAYAVAHGELLYKKTTMRTVETAEEELQTKSNIRKHFVHADLELIENDSDAVVVLYDEAARRGAGTISECQHAYNRDIPVFLVSYYEDWKKEVPGWLQALATRSFRSFEALYEYFSELPPGILVRDRYGNRHSGDNTGLGDKYLCSLCGTVFTKNKHHFVSKVSPLYCSPCVDLVSTTHEELSDRYEFFMDYLEEEALDEMCNIRNDRR